MIEKVKLFLRSRPGVLNALKRFARTPVGQRLYIQFHRIRLRRSLSRQSRRLFHLLNEEYIRGSTPHSTPSVNLLLDGFSFVYDEDMAIKATGAKIDNRLDLMLAHGTREIERRFYSSVGLSVSSLATSEQQIDPDAPAFPLGSSQALGILAEGMTAETSTLGASTSETTVKWPQHKYSARGQKLEAVLHDVKSKHTKSLTEAKTKFRDKLNTTIQTEKAKKINALAEAKAKFRDQLKHARLEDRNRFKTNIAELRQANQRLLQEFRKVPVQRYGALQTGHKEWEERWDASKGRRILLYALSDYSGSFYKWAVAINRHTEYAARLVTYNVHQFGYNTDIVLPFPDVLKRSNMKEIADEADIIHMKDESGFFLKTNNLPPDLFDSASKPKIYTAYGGYVRKLKEDSRFRNYVQSFDARIAMTPDLNYEWFNGYFIPHAIDTDAYPFSWVDGVMLAHSPSTKARKGTDDLIKAIEGMDIEFDLIHGVPHAECVDRKSKANVFFDQAGREIQDKLGIDTVIGWYGNSALEAAVFGIPTIAHMSDIAFDGAERAGRDIRDSCAIINTGLGAEEIRQTLETYFRVTSNDRRALALRTREWVSMFHSYQACAAELVKVYDKLL